MKQLREYKSVPLETVMENRAAEMNGSCEVSHTSLRFQTLSSGHMRKVGGEEF